MYTSRIRGRIGNAIVIGPHASSRYRNTGDRSLFYIKPIKNRCRCARILRTRSLSLSLSPPPSLFPFLRPRKYYLFLSSYSAFLHSRQLTAVRLWRVLCSTDIQWCILWAVCTRFDNLRVKMLLFPPSRCRRDPSRVPSSKSFNSITRRSE